MVAAAICLKTVRGELQVLLVRTTDGQRMTFPKGHSQGDEKPYETAVRELQEEAGYVGHPKFAPVARQVPGGGAEETAYVLIRAAEPVDEPEQGRKPAWYSLESAVFALTKNRSPEEAGPLLHALKTAINWYQLQ